MGWDTNKWVNCITLWNSILFEKPVFIQLVKILPVFYGIWRFITWSTWASHWIMFWTTLFQFTISCLVFYVHFNVVSSTPRSRKWSVSFLFSDWNFDLISLKYLMQIINVEASHYANELSLLLFPLLRSIYCPPHPTGWHPHWHHITKWLFPCIYRQHIVPVFVKCHFSTVELDILHMKLWPLCCLLMDVYHHVMWCAISQKNEVLRWTAEEAK
jgi:hypothetical protein